MYITRDEFSYRAKYELERILTTPDYIPLGYTSRPYGVYGYPPPVYPPAYPQVYPPVYPPVYPTVYRPAYPPVVFPHYGVGFTPFGTFW